MDSTPSTSGLNISPPKKRTCFKLGHLSLAEKVNILNIYKNLKHSNPELKMTVIISQIQKTLGVAKSTVYRVIKEHKETGEVTSPKPRPGRHSFLHTYDEGVKTAVRRIIHSFYFKNELPTLDRIITEVKKREDLPQMSRSTLYLFMKLINFKYMKRQRKSILIERDDIVRWRRSYLTAMRDYRKENRPIYYLDETWLNEGHTKEKIWIDQDILNKRQAFLEGLSTGLKNPTGKGRRLIILHIGCAEGFVDNGLLLFEGKKTADYHEEMNASVFENWFSTIIKKLPNNAVIVMDNASYHSRKCEKIPTSSSRKTIMQEWLASKNINFEVDMVRSELLHLIQLHRGQYNMYVTDEMAKAENKTVLRLPPYHCELNPIELVWAQIKNEVASKNQTFKLDTVKTLLLQAINNVTSEKWTKCIEHVVKEEKKMITLDGLMDDIIEPILISVGNDSESDSDHWSDSE